MPDFFNPTGGLTADGRAVLDHLTARVEEALKVTSPAAFNSMAGPYKHFGTNVVMLGTMTPEKWLREYDYAGQAIHALMTEAATQQKVREQAEAASAGQSALESELAKLKTIVEAQAAEISALKAGGKDGGKKKDADKGESEA